MARPGNWHCANCIGTLSFPIADNRRRVLRSFEEQFATSSSDGGAAN